jgi:hypothetical protein
MPAWPALNYSPAEPFPAHPVSQGMRHLARLIITTVLSLGIGTSTIVHAGGKQCSARSGTQRVALVELYTSEGCSSCPPADKWLSGLPANGLGPDKVIPLAFHVDYWDYIGWSDPFARPAHTQRQRDIAQLNSLRTIYTPQVVVNGRDFRHWYWQNRLHSAVEQINRSPARARISLSLHDISNLQLQARGRFALLPQQYPHRAAAYIALYQNNQSSAVSAGENAGEILRHNYVVRELHGPFGIHNNGMLEIEQTIKLNPSWPQRDIGVVAFVQDQSNGDILQALARSLCK